MFEAKLQVHNEEIRKEMKKEITNMKNSFQDKMHRFEVNIKKRMDNNTMTIEDKEPKQRVTKVEIDFGESKTLIDKISGRINDVEDIAGSGNIVHITSKRR
eukprot:Seg5863.2 transcript_id=Seg5863.2/GoldUCD/mRNA.D3Y31 product="hypothetical protein" protein_id=Seg5863.2/GoldUCD/D3Y31